MSKNSEMVVETEWSHFFDVRTMEKSRVEVSISPNQDEAHRLALRLGLLSLDSLVADILVKHGSNDVAYHVKGKMKADVTQACVVTLEPVKTHIAEEFEAWFADPQGPVSFKKLQHERDMVKAHGEMPILEEKDDPEPMVDGKIDLGEAVTQFLSLAIDPYPHAEGVEYVTEPPKSAAEGSDEVKNPFAALKDWKARLTGEDH